MYEAQQCNLYQTIHWLYSRVLLHAYWHWVYLLSDADTVIKVLLAEKVLLSGFIVYSIMLINIDDVI